MSSVCNFGATVLVTSQMLLNEKPLSELKDEDFKGLLKLKDAPSAPAAGGPVHDLMLEAPKAVVPPAFLRLLAVPEVAIKPTAAMLDGFTELWQGSSAAAGTIEVHVDSGASAGGAKRYWVKCKADCHPPCGKWRQTNQFADHIEGVSWMCAWAAHGSKLGRASHVALKPSDIQIGEFKDSIVRKL